MLPGEVWAVRLAFVWGGKSTPSMQQVGGAKSEKYLVVCDKCCLVGC